LNGVIADLEVYEAIQNLKNNKAPGTDKILNEYLKHSPPLHPTQIFKILKQNSPDLYLGCSVYW
jgi:hypothetical protein